MDFQTLELLHMAMTELGSDSSKKKLRNLLGEECVDEKQVITITSKYLPANYNLQKVQFIIQWTN